MNPQSRRYFLGNSGRAGALAALGAIVHPIARASSASPNERPNVALIGCGGRGLFIIRVRANLRGHV